MAADVYDGPEEHLVGDLSVEPLVLIERKPPHLWSNPSQESPAHGDTDHQGIERKVKTCSSRDPDGLVQGIQGL